MKKEAKTILTLLSILIWVDRSITALREITFWKEAERGEHTNDHDAWWDEVRTIRGEPAKRKHCLGLGANGKSWECKQKLSSTCNCPGGWIGCHKQGWDRK